MGGGRKSGRGKEDEEEEEEDESEEDDEGESKGVVSSHQHWSCEWIYKKHTN